MFQLRVAILVSLLVLISFPGVLFLGQQTHQVQQISDPIAIAVATIFAYPALDSTHRATQDIILAWYMLMIFLPAWIAIFCSFGEKK